MMFKKLSPKTFARIIGLLYLSLFFLGPLAFFMGRTSIVVPGDSAATLDKLLVSESMFRIGMVAETLIVLIEIVVSAMLYVLLRKVSQSLALAAVFARFGQAMLQAVNLFTAVPALLILGGASYFVAFNPEQIQAILMIFIETNAFIIMIWGILFGFHLLLLGLLVYQSNFWPKFIGVLLIIGSVGYFLQSYGHLVNPTYDATFANLVLLLSIPGELAFVLWLLIKGIDTKKYNKLASKE